MGKPGKGNASGRGNDQAGEPVTATTSNTAQGGQVDGGDADAQARADAEAQARAAAEEEAKARAEAEALEQEQQAEAEIERQDAAAREARMLASLTKEDACRFINEHGRDAYTGAPIAAELQLDQIFAFRFTREKLTVVTVDGRKFIVTREGR
jgi:membrane protein involved in colicin uptake